EPGDALRARLEVQPQRALHGDLAEAEMRGGEDPDVFALHEAPEERDDRLRLLEGNLPALVTKTLAHGNPEGRRVDELNFSPSLGRLAIGEYPDVGGNARVVEKLLRQRDQRLEPVGFQNEASDLTLA